MRTATANDLDPNRRVALYTLIKLHETMSLLLEATDPDELPGCARHSRRTATETGPTRYRSAWRLLGGAGRPAAGRAAGGRDGRLGGAAALGLLTEMLELACAARGAGGAGCARSRWTGIGDVEAERELLAPSRTPRPLPADLGPRIASDCGDAERGWHCCVPRRHRT